MLASQASQEQQNVFIAHPGWSRGGNWMKTGVVLGSLAAVALLAMLHVVARHDKTYKTTLDTDSV